MFQVHQRDPLPGGAVQLPRGQAGAAPRALDQHRHQLRLPRGDGGRQPRPLPGPPTLLHQGQVQGVEAGTEHPQGGQSLEDALAYI